MLLGRTTREFQNAARSELGVSGPAELWNSSGSLIDERLTTQGRSRIGCSACAHPCMKLVRPSYRFGREIGKPGDLMRPLTQRTRLALDLGDAHTSADRCAEREKLLSLLRAP